jgi:fibronectin type 3 domain-containing protein
MDSPMEVISPGLSATTFSDTSSVSGRVQYVYAVKAVNHNSLESEFSNLVTIRQAVRQLPAPPSGIATSLNSRTAIVVWPSVAIRDHAVAGYNVYRRELDGAKQFDLEQSAAAQAEALKFTLLNTLLITSSRFEDTNIEQGKTYEYAVASVDRFGMESTFSSFGIVDILNPSRLVTTCYIRKVSNGVNLSWDPGFATDADAVTIYRKKAGETNYQRIAVIKPSTQSYTDRTPIAGTLYVYIMRAEQGKRVIARSDEKNIRY